MSGIPLLSSTDLVRILGRFGYSPILQSGTHHHLFCAGTRRLLTVPSHPVLALGIVLAVIGKAGLDPEDFLCQASAGAGEPAETKES